MIDEETASRLTGSGGAERETESTVGASEQTPDFDEKQCEELESLIVATAIAIEHWRFYAHAAVHVVGDDDPAAEFLSGIAQLRRELEPALAKATAGLGLVGRFVRDFEHREQSALSYALADHLRSRNPDAEPIERVAERLHVTARTLHDAIEGRSVARAALIAKNGFAPDGPVKVAHAAVADVLEVDPRTVERYAKPKTEDVFTRLVDRELHESSEKKP